MFQDQGRQWDIGMDDQKPNRLKSASARLEEQRGPAADLLRSAGYILREALRHTPAFLNALFEGLVEIGKILIEGWRKLSGRTRGAILGGLLLLYALNVAWDWRHVPGHWWDHVRGNRPLNSAKSWHYHLMSNDLAGLTRTNADLIVTEHSQNNGGDNYRIWTKEDVDKMKLRPDGSKRLVVSYFSIGEAESYRFYWKPEWKEEDDMPGWYVVENCAWPRNYMVRYWHDGWKDIIYRHKRSYLRRIIDAGFDGVYLDRVDVFWEQIKDRPTAREDMIQFVKELAETARKLKPGFIVIAQNAEDLLDEKRYRDIIDGLGKEDLLHGLAGTNTRNKPDEITTSLKHINHLLWDWKPVFAVEYVTKPELIASARKELQSYGFIPTIAHRSLDGLDPLAERPPSTIKYGTPEWIAEQCKDKPHW